MIIGNFRFDAAADTYTGEIRTLHIQRSGVVLRPLRKTNDREPDYRIVQHADGGSVELGAAWRRRTDKGQDYLSVLLDDPTLPQPLPPAPSASNPWKRRIGSGRGMSCPGSRGW